MISGNDQLLSVMINTSALILGLSRSALGSSNFIKNFIVLFSNAGKMVDIEPFKSIRLILTLTGIPTSILLEFRSELEASTLNCSRLAILTSVSPSWTFLPMSLLIQVMTPSSGAFTDVSFSFRHVLYLLLSNEYV